MLSSDPRPGRLHPAPEIRARHLLRAPAGNGTATVAGLYSTGTCPQKTGGSGDRLNAARAKPEERKRHRRACGKAKRHLPGLLLPLLPVQSPMQASYASGVAKDRHESAPSRAACLNGPHAVPRQAAARRTNLALQGGAWLMWLAGQGILADERQAFRHKAHPQAGHDTVQEQQGGLHTTKQDTTQTEPMTKMPCRRYARA